MEEGHHLEELSREERDQMDQSKKKIKRCTNNEEDPHDFEDQRRSRPQPEASINGEIQEGVSYKDKVTDFGIPNPKSASTSLLHMEAIVQTSVYESSIAVECLRFSPMAIHRPSPTAFLVVFCSSFLLYYLPVSVDRAIAALNYSGVILGTLPIRVSPSKTPVRSRAPRTSMQ
ncbi:polyadenylate-binding protein-interacting protein 12-like [Senna tora]|uniref:Polyadenylate-binding protein-interacting protein 12-like n=1 Tax=Senna tora TaxID=362788 RepID=A0A834TQV0_9FABA|nr:polyadenylate-binding protein-interacting protein 12-like [Senna tora]